jgi:hypothetical protein
LKSGDATLAQFSTAQAEGGWATGAEQEIHALGSSTPFSYGGASGLVKGAPGVASVAGDTKPPAAGHTLLSTIFTLGGHLPGGGVIAKVPDNPSSVAKDLASSVFGPVASWIEEGAADVTFVGFGLLLVIVGLVVTFKGGSSDSINLTAPPSSSSPSGGVAEAGGAAKDAAVAAVAA